MKIDHHLDQSIDFQSIQFLAENETDQDVLGGQEVAARHKNWEKIRSYSQDAIQKNEDARLQVLIYRSELVLGDFSTALMLMNNQIHTTQLHADEAVESQDKYDGQLFNALTYFVSKTHIDELRQSYLDLDRSITCSDLLQIGLNLQSKANLEEQQIELFKNWATQHSELLEIIDHSKQTIHEIASWVESNNQIGLSFETSKVLKWFAKLQETMMQLGAVRKHTHAAAGTPGSQLQTVVSKLDSTGATSERQREMKDWDRKHVKELLGQISSWFEQNEPTHPAPYFIRRVQKMMDSDFLSLIQELLPESVNQFEQMTGVQKGK